MKNKLMVFLFWILGLSCHESIAQNFSKDAQLLSAKLIDYLASGDLMDTKENVRAITKIVNRISDKKDTTAVLVLLDVYLTYDALENDVKSLTYKVLLQFKQQAIPVVDAKIKIAEEKYGIHKIKHTDYMDLIAIRNKML